MSTVSDGLLLTRLVAGMNSEEEVLDALRKLKAYENGVFKSIDRLIIVKIGKDTAKRLRPDAIRINEEYYLAYKNTECGVEAVKEAEGTLKGVKLLRLSSICLEECGNGVSGIYGKYEVARAVRKPVWRRI